MAWRYSPMVFLLLATPLFAQYDTATQRLTEQSKQFDELVVQVADNVYTAVGFSVSNVSMIIGNDGVVIVDTGMMLDAAGRIATAFRKRSDKPVKAIIFTHSHGDHTGGAAAFLGKERPQIWAHKNFGSEARPLVAGGVTFQNVRGARQAGFKLPPEQRINNGIAPVRYGLLTICRGRIHRCALAESLRAGGRCNRREFQWRRIDSGGDTSASCATIPEPKKGWFLRTLRKKGSVDWTFAETESSVGYNRVRGEQSCPRSHA